MLNEVLGTSLYQVLLAEECNLEPKQKVLIWAKKDLKSPEKPPNS